MGITVQHNGASIKRPGSYSKTSVDNSGGAPIGTNDTLFLVGEAAAGAPSSSTGIVEYSASRLDALIANYKSGPIVDCAVAARKGSKTPGVGGPGKYLVYKTNASLQASAVLLKSAVSQFSVKGSAWGVSDNNYSVVVAAGSTSNQKLITVTEVSGTTESLGENAAENILSITYTGDATTAVVAVAGASRAALTLTTTLAGDQTDGSANLSITLANYTVKELVDLINGSTGYTCLLLAPTKSAKTANELDVTASVTIKSAVVNILRLQTEILELLNTSIRVEATETGILGGVPSNATYALTGGAQGASTNANFSTAFSKSLGKDYNVLLPCISRDATTDIADADLGFTDASSTYTIASVLAAAGSHLGLRGNTRNRKEAQGMGGYRNAAKATCYTTVAALSDYNLQVAIEDVVFVNAEGNSVVGQPHVHAAMLAGIRLGTAVGEPLTYKSLNASFVGHFINPTTLLVAGDFDSGEDGDDAIDNGIIFAEEHNGGYRVVVDNTTYGTDQSFVYNRGSVIEATYFVQKTLRDLTDEVFIGGKTSNGVADSIKVAIRSKMQELNAPDVQVTSASDGAPDGFDEETFVVTVTGATATVQIRFYPVSGLDWVLYSFTVGEATQTA